VSAGENGAPTAGRLLPAVSVDRIYSRRARHYDLLHTLTTSGADRRWRREAAWLLGPREEAKVLDLCTGIGLSALELVRVWSACGIGRFSVLGVDYNRAMLARGRELIARAGVTDRIELAWGDVTDLRRGAHEAGLVSLEDRSFDAVLSVCGVGGLERPRAAFREALRVLRPAGRLVVIDIHRPIESLQTARLLQRWVWRHVTRPWVMRRLWGWNDPSDFREAIAAAELDGPERRRYRFEILTYQVRSEPWWLGLPFCWIAVLVGRKVEVSGAGTEGGAER
jgi:ubiquinone/menaquinone biosynthesis C-methylase UbiE